MVAGIQKMLPARSFRTSWRVLDVWAKRVPAEQVPPAPAEVAHACAVLLAYSGLWAEGTALLLCFTGLLRISEALRLTRSDVVPVQQDGRLAFVLCLGVTKRGQEQKVLIEAPRVVAWLEHVYSRCFKRGPFLPTTYGRVSRALAVSLVVLGFEKLSLSTHSFRRGGATRLLQAGWPLSSIMVMGRWMSESSCRVYLRKAEVALLRCHGRFPAEAWALAANVAAVGEQVFRLRQLDSSG